MWIWNPLFPKNAGPLRPLSGARLFLRGRAYFVSPWISRTSPGPRPEVESLGKTKPKVMRGDGEYFEKSSLFEARMVVRSALEPKVRRRLFQEGAWSLNSFLIK
jgi:hypothetical protein